MRLFNVLLFIIICSEAYAQDCKQPDFRATFKEKYQEIGVSAPDFLEDANIVINNSSSHKIKWVGLYSEGPVSGAILVYSCSGEVLSVQQTGGIKSIEYFHIPGDVGPAISVEEVITGTGSYRIKKCYYTFIDGKILKILDHTEMERSFVIPSENGTMDSFEFLPSKHDNEQIVVEGVRKIYPVNSSDPKTFRVEKLKTEAYCWGIEKREYLICK